MGWFGPLGAAGEVLFTPTPLNEGEEESLLEHRVESLEDDLAACEGETEVAEDPVEESGFDDLGGGEDAIEMCEDPGIL